MPKAPLVSLSSETRVPRNREADIIITCEKFGNSGDLITYRPLLIFPSNNDKWITPNTTYFQSSGLSNAMSKNFIHDPDTTKAIRGTWLPTTGPTSKPVGENNAGWILKLNAITMNYHENTRKSGSYTNVWLCIMLDKLKYYDDLLDFLKLYDLTTKNIITTFYFFSQIATVADMHKFCTKLIRLYYVVSLVSVYFITWEQFQQSAQLGSGIWDKHTIHFDTSDYPDVFPDGFTLTTDYSTMRNFVLSHGYDSKTKTFFPIKKLSKINVKIDIKQHIKDKDYIDCDVSSKKQDAHVIEYLKDKNAYVDAPEGYEDWVKKGTQNPLFPENFDKVKIDETMKFNALFPFNRIFDFKSNLVAMNKRMNPPADRIRIPRPPPKENSNSPKEKSKSPTPPPKEKSKSPKKHATRRKRSPEPSTRVLRSRRDNKIL